MELSFDHFNVVSLRISFPQDSLTFGTCNAEGGVFLVTLQLHDILLFCHHPSYFKPSCLFLQAPNLCIEYELFLHTCTEDVQVCNPFPLQGKKLLVQLASLSAICFFVLLYLGKFSLYDLHLAKAGTPKSGHIPAITPIRLSIQPFP